MSCTWLIWAELGDRGVRRASLELLGRARALGHQAVAVVVGGDGALAAPWADRVVEVPGQGGPQAVVHALAHLADEQSPTVIAAGTSVHGREILARLAARLGAPLAAECIAIEADTVVCAVHGGKAYARLQWPEGLCLVGLRPNSMPLPLSGAPGPVLRLELDPGPAQVQRLELTRAGASERDIQEAEVIVAAGRGIGSAEGFALAEALGEALDAAVGASRAAVDAGWRPHGDQVGKSGKTVSPRLYVALGISGAVHHVMGMDTSGVVVAVNTDPSAPIFQHADYGIVGDLRVVVPALVDALGSR